MSPVGPTLVAELVETPPTRLTLDLDRLDHRNSTDLDRLDHRNKLQRVE
jgi:hypothetical protein